MTATSVSNAGGDVMCEKRHVMGPECSLCVSLAFRVLSAILVAGLSRALAEYQRQLQHFDACLFIDDEDANSSLHMQAFF
jgi:hypothetical protein